MTNIYTLEHGRLLMNPTSYNTRIVQYLAAESEQLGKAASSYDVVIEAGCTAGRHAALVLASQKHYIGIDIARQYIDEAEATFAGSKATFLCADLMECAAYIEQCHAGRKKLPVFPFNISGNLPAPYQLLQMLWQLNAPFIIFTYSTDTMANLARQEYYQRSGFPELQSTITRDGVRFSSGEGLNTIAYSRRWFREAWARYGFDWHELPVGDIGRAYTNCSACI